MLVWVARFPLTVWDTDATMGGAEAAAAAASAAGLDTSAANWAALDDELDEDDA